MNEGERRPARWDPIRDLERWLRARFGQTGSALEDFFGRGLASRGLAAPLDITENGQGYRVTVELPGVKREDVSIDVQDRVVSIRGEKKAEREEKKERGHWLERTYGSFGRSFTLPPDALEDKIEASFKDGVLRLQIARTEKRKPRTIAVKGESVASPLARVGRKSNARRAPGSPRRPELPLRSSRGRRLGPPR